MGNTFPEMSIFQKFIIIFKNHSKWEWFNVFETHYPSLKALPFRSSAKDLNLGFRTLRKYIIRELIFGQNSHFSHYFSPAILLRWIGWKFIEILEFWWLSQQQHRERQCGCSEGRTNYTEENNRFKMTQSRVLNGRCVNVIHVDSIIVFLPYGISLNIVYDFFVMHWHT